MLATLLLTALTGLPIGQEKQTAPKKDGLQKADLFGQADWYQKSEAKEEQFKGLIQKPFRGRSSRNPLELRYSTAETIRSDEKSGTVRVSFQQVGIFTGDKYEIFEKFVGKNVKLIGKWVNFAIGDTRITEIWVAHIELDDVGKNDAQDTKLKIHAKAAWPFASDGDKKGKQHVLRSAVELVSTHTIVSSVTADMAKKATDELAKAFKVKDIDWTKQMVVVVSAGMKPTGGYQIDIQSVTAAGKDATVTWKIDPPQGIAIQVLTNPSVMALVDRVDGEVKFDPAIK